MRKLRFDDEEDEKEERIKETEAVSAAEIISNDSFERLLARNRRRSTEEILVVVGLVCFLVAALAFLCGYLFFKAENVTVVGNELYGTEAILREAGITPEDNLFSVSEADLRKRLTAAFPYLRRVTLERSLPTSLTIRVEEDTPQYFTEIAGDYFLLSGTLRVLERAKCAEDFTGRIPDLLPVRVPEIKKAIVGSELVFPRDATFRYMNDLLNTLEASPIRPFIDTVDVSEKFNIRLYLYDARLCVSIGGTDDLNAKLTFLTRILGSQVEETTIATINIKKAETAYVTYREKDFSDQLLK